MKGEVRIFEVTETTSLGRKDSVRGNTDEGRCCRHARRAAHAAHLLCNSPPHIVLVPACFAIPHGK